MGDAAYPVACDHDSPSSVFDIFILKWQEIGEEVSRHLC